jgi:predicted  nucleic acid-binding Zn-ribbon protein
LAPLKFICSVCGEKQKIGVNVPSAPSFEQMEVKCEKCKNKTHLIITSCPECGVNSLRYFQSDLDFPAELLSLAGIYVKIIQEIKDSLKEHIEEFDVPVPKRWSAKLECDNGHEFKVEISLPQLSD